MHPSYGAVGATASRRSPGLRGFWHRLREMHIHPGSAVMAFGVFWLSFVRWFGIPSPFCAAFLAAWPARLSPAGLLSLAASLAFRLVCGLEMDVWQYVGCAALWLVLQKCRLRNGAETAAMSGLAMAPRIFAALAADKPLDLLLSCAALPAAMLASIVFRCGLDAVRLKGSRLQKHERLCMLITGLLIISGLGWFRAGPVNLGQMVSVTAVLVFAAANGPVYGVCGGCLSAFALALGGHDARLLPALALCGLFGGLPMVKRMRWLSVPFALSANLLAWFLSRMDEPIISLWTCAAGAVIFVCLKSGFLNRLNPYLHGGETGGNCMENAFVTQRIDHMRTAIENLARALPEWEDEETAPGEELGETLCARCINREQCWGRRRGQTERMLSGMVELCAKGEAISEQTLPVLSQHGCLRLEAAPEAAGDMLRKRHKRQAVLKKASYERKLTLTHLAALSGTLEELGSMAVGESMDDLRAAHRITLALEELRVPAHLSYARRVDGHLQAELLLDGMMPMQKALDQLLYYLAQTEDMPLSVSRVERGRVELEEIPLYSASVGMASLCAEGSGEVCGDACCAKRCEGGRLLMMLCDGMGHGASAHKQSEKTLELLLLLLEAGYTRHQAITAVNGIMLGVEAEEKFSTVDLADVDLWTGEVYGEKLGACASWVVRGNHMKKVEGSSLPLGILQEAQSTAAQYRLHSGDILILMSDGVADAMGNDVHTRKIISESLFIQPQRMADAILRNALVAGGGAPRDDMTVMVMLMMDRRHV